MNYFGHAAVAARYSQDPLVALGAMLPDFVGFLRWPLPPLSDASLSVGVALHHATDRVFHRTPTFVSLNRAASEKLAALSVARGPARATAHVGVEMLLDACLAARRESCTAFRCALDEASGDHVRRALALPAQHHQRLLNVVRAIRERGAEVWSSEPSIVAQRLARTFATRPRLRLDDSVLPLVECWLESAYLEVQARSIDLEDELHRGLASEWSDPGKSGAATAG